MDCGELVYACALSLIFNYKCDDAKRLLDEFVLPSAVFSLSRSELKDIFGPRSHYPDELLDHRHLEKSVAEVEWAENHGVKIIYMGDTLYPKRLKECNDAPLVLFYKGTSNLNHSRIISMVGTRRASSQGKEICRKIVADLSALDEKPIIVSGLAYGIDIAAHIAALECGLETIGVMATGIDQIYPAEHRKYAVKMVSKGGVLTDFPHKTPSYKVNFLRRNRIIAGISDATILIESKEDGGGVITSKMAASYDREVFAVPWRMTDPSAGGCLSLIKDHVANVMTGSGSVADELGWSTHRDKTMNMQRTIIFESDNEIKRNILLALRSRPELDIDSVLQSVDADYKDIMFNITELEMEGRIRLGKDGRYRPL